ncbi:MAG: type II toxin-antitoxin system RelE/ParE family toxin [Bradyrhizobium sp.]|uniref:type II toxin-antitoxin system RelE/ParE family toxin n=1 Tax=Bradyrhizobium sp. TaxID=376 RepID=UPI0025C13A8F|nr:type II toxin-antitoxin system RelE/ParE family toxin [Bradyrhizobium sp.]MBI5263293.1 type II toxin-antitoxin system RelE/ParE family toxin [Bradyrhizobium sp.]
MRIIGFRHKALERFWRDDDIRGLPPKQVEKIRAMLTAVSEAEKLVEIERYSGWRLHQLKGDRRGTWAMVVTRNYRLTFKLIEKNVAEIDLEDYHGK